MKELMLGNEAIARGAYEANVWVATAYPGTPSSEVMETVGMKYKDINSEWSINEKVAMEVALGSAIAGVRSMVVMKHVGMNVAADPFMTAAYTGVNAGFVIVVADDPSEHSSQNEQDTRNYAKFAKVPLFEPMNSQEAKDFTKIALDVSEEFDSVSILRTVTRISHTKSVVELKEPVRNLPDYQYKKNEKKYVMIPAFSRPRHEFVLEREKSLREFSEKFEYNTVEYNDKSIGIITHGLIYNHVKEAMPEASILKISMYPIPIQKIKEFAANVDKLYVVEELDPIIEEEVKAAGIEVIGKDIIPMTKELDVDVIKRAFGKESTASAPEVGQLPGRPPSLCKGCSHIEIFEILKEINATVLGDIGCYTLGVLPPYSAIDTTICMGASVGNEAGFRKVGELNNVNTNSVAVIGDSTFFHSGLTGLLNAVYNQTPITLLILDNRITAMTGHQPSPHTGYDSRLNLSVPIDIEQIVKGLGVKRVRKIKVTPKTRDEVKAAIIEEINANEPSVLVMDEICVIAEPKVRKFLKEKRGE